MLKQAYVASKDELRELLLEMSFSLPKYSDLDWRLDVQVRTFFRVFCSREQLSNP